MTIMTFRIPLTFRPLPALVLYEHAITFGLEVQQIWQRNISGAAILFILTRYITLINRILVTISLTSIRSLEVRTLGPLPVIETDFLQQRSVRAPM